MIERQPRIESAKDGEVAINRFAGKKVVCLPCTGGSSTYFHRLREHLSPFAEVVLIDYAGHGRRMNEPFDSNLEDTLRDAGCLIKEMANDSEFILFGYSMGGLLSYVLAADPQYGIEPNHVVICSFQSPDILKAKQFHINDECEEKQFLERYGYVDKRFYQDQRFEKAFLTPLKHDFRNLTRFSLPKLNPLSCGITVLYGEQDFAENDVVGWKKYSQVNTEIIEMPGKHFFLNENLDSIVELIRSKC